MAAPLDDPSADAGSRVDPDEATLADEEWPVAEHYRVEPGEAPEEGTVVVREGEAPPGSTRRFPRDVSPALLAIVVAAALLIPAAILASRYARDDDAPRAAPTGATTPTTAPSTTPTQPSGSSVADVVGMQLDDARAALEAAGLRVRVDLERSDRPDGEVVSQDPGAGTAASTKVVVLTVSRGAGDVGVPDVDGLTAAAAGRALREAGLTPEIRLVRSSERAGTVVRQDPPATEEVEPASIVRLDVARGPAEPEPKPAPAQPTTVEVPDVVGLTVAEARSSLRDLGLRSSIARVARSQPEGTVVGQTPRAGAELRKGQRVRLQVSSGPTDVEIPDVTGMDEESARQQLTTAGFDVAVVDEPTDDPAQDGVVLDQEPRGGADEGTTVTLTVARFT